MADVFLGALPAARTGGGRSRVKILVRLRDHYRAQGRNNLADTLDWLVRETADYEAQADSIPCCVRCPLRRYQ